MVVWSQAHMYVRMEWGSPVREAGEGGRACEMAAALSRMAVMRFRMQLRKSSWTAWHIIPSVMYVADKNSPLRRQMHHDEQAYSSETRVHIRTS